VVPEAQGREDQYEAVISVKSKNIDYLLIFLM
jgi:hypothetical protein